MTWPKDWPKYYDRFGRPIPLEEWAMLLESPEYKVIGYDEIPTTSRYVASYLSTVWLGLDHSFTGGPPLLFETMRFSNEAKPLDLFPDRTYHPVLDFPDPNEPGEYTEQLRYCTEEQASLAHKRILKLIHETEMS